MIDLSKLSQNMWDTSQKKNTNPYGDVSSGGLASPSGYGGTSTPWETNAQQSGGAMNPWATTTSGGQSNTTTSDGTDWTAGSYNPFTQPNSGYEYITQPWYRNSDWIGGAIWNPTYGWQEVNQIKGLYGGQSATDEQMAQWGITPNLTGSWEDYIDQLGYTNEEIGGGGPPGGTGSGEIFEDIFDEKPIDRGTAYLSEEGDFSGVDQFGQQPKEWQTASDVLRSFAQTGNPVDIPNQWGAASQGAYDMLRNQGQATDTSEAYRTAKRVSDYDTQEAIKSAMEQAGLSGNRWSSGAQRTAADIGGKYASQLGAQYAQQAMSAQEAARGRQMGAADQLYGYGTGYAGLDTDARNRALTATGQLGGLGQAMTQYPMDLAKMAFGQGTTLGAQDQASYDRLFQEFLRGTAENNPWLNYAMQLGTGQGMQQQFTPGAGSQWMSGLSSLLPFLFL